MGVVFAGVERIIPGAYGTVDTSGLVSIGLVAGGVLSIIGPAKGGTPNLKLPYNDPAVAKRDFRGGDLLDAAIDAWGEGATVIYLTRVGTLGSSVSPAALSLFNSSATPTASVKLTSKILGTDANKIRAKVESGTNSGFKVTVQFTDLILGAIITEIYDDEATAATLIADINATTKGSNLVVASLLGSASDVLSNLSFNSFSGGLDNDSPEVQEWYTAIDAYNTEWINIIHLARLTDATVHAYLKTSNVNLYTKRRPRIGVVGGALGEPVGDSNTALSACGRAYNLNSDRMVLAYPGCEAISGTYADSVGPSSVTAAKIAGAIASVSISTPLTRRAINTSAIEVEMEETDQESCISGGVLAVIKAISGYTIVRGITTAQDISAIQENSFKEISTRRIVDNVEATILTNLDGAFVGKAGVSGIESTIASEVRGILSKFKDNLQIVDFGQSITVTPDATIPGVYYVTYSIRPTPPVNFILVTTKVVNVI